ncbi:MAG: hypothetical protein GY861_29275 [bacterium]|nr:hypothetical protein [bacterium]
MKANEYTYVREYVIDHYTFFRIKEDDKYDMLYDGKWKRMENRSFRWTKDGYDHRQEIIEEDEIFLEFI